VIGKFGQSALGGNGIDISGRAGQPVLAAAGGEVVYSGSGLIGYGRLIIVKHNQTYLSAYGHNRELRVVEGDRVSAGQTIALMGEGPGRKPVLHFEIRRNGKPVDPLRYLPGR
jgi:lipoprotein NlpD